MAILVDKDQTTFGPDGNTMRKNLLHTLLQCTAHHIQAYHSDIAHDFAMLNLAKVGDTLVIFVNINGTHSYWVTRPNMPEHAAMHCTLAEMLDIQSGISVKAVWKVERTSEENYNFTEMETIK